MKTKIGIILLVVLSIGCAAGQEKQQVAPQNIKPLPRIGDSVILYDFNAPDIMNKRNVDFGTWELHASYTAEIAAVKPADAKEAGARGTVLMIDYDVSMPEKDMPSTDYPVYNGVWVKLKGMDLSGYDTLLLWIKGDKKRKYTAVCKLELKSDFKETASYYIETIGPDWKQFKIPLNYFRTVDGKPLKNLTSMKELTIVFEKSHVTAQAGVICVDDIGFAKLHEAKRKETAVEGKAAKKETKTEKKHKGLIPPLF